MKKKKLIKILTDFIWTTYSRNNKQAYSDGLNTGRRS